VRVQHLALRILAGLAGLAVISAAGWYATWYCYPSEAAPLEDGAAFAVDQEQHESRGFGADAARVDSQITFRIPDGQAGAVYEYLKGKYVGKTGILHDRFPDLDLHGQAMSDVSLFTDEYYDTPSLDLYRTLNSTRHRTRINTTNPGDRKSGRELVQMKITPRGDFTMRSEFKYKVSRANGHKTMGDLHPLIRLIDIPQREDFEKVFRNAGIDPYALKYFFTIRQVRSRGYINWGDTNIFSFSVDEGRAGILWAEGRFASVDMGLVENEYTEADEARRETMWAIRDAIIEDLLQHFPELTQTTNSKYGILLTQMMHELPVIPLLFRVS